jgi:hypothetical protein
MRCSPEVAALEEKNRRIRDMIAGHHRSSPVAEVRERDTEHPIYTDFKNEVAQGKWSPSQEDVDKLLLIPRFEPSGMLEIDADFFVAHKRARPRLGSLGPDQHDSLKKRARKRARHSYEKAFGKVPVLTDASELEEESYETLIKAVQKLSGEVKHLERQNQTLTAHLSLLQMAKEQLECQAKCVEEVLKWKRGCISEVVGCKIVPKAKSLGHLSVLSDRRCNSV